MQDLENPSATSQLESRAREQAESAKEQIRSFAEMGKDKLADQLEHVAHALKSTSDQLQSEESEPISRYASAAGERIERASRFLRERRAIDLVDKIEDVARSQPLMFLGGAFAIGLALGRFLKSTTPDEISFERGYGAGPEISGGYPEPEEVVLTSPTTTVGDIPGGFVAEDGASFPTDRVSTPGERGPTGNVPS